MDQVYERDQRGKSGELKVLFIRSEDQKAESKVMIQKKSENDSKNVYLWL